MNDQTEIPIPKFIRRLMPSATERERVGATESFMQYMQIVERMHERIMQEAKPDSSESEFCGRVPDNNPNV